MQSSKIPTEFCSESTLSSNFSSSVSLVSYDQSTRPMNLINMSTCIQAANMRTNAFGAIRDAINLLEKYYLDHILIKLHLSNLYLQLAGLLKESDEEFRNTLECAGTYIFNCVTSSPRLQAELIELQQWYFDLSRSGTN